MLRFIMTTLLFVSASTAAVAEKYALLIGVEKYAPTELTSLQYAEDDVLAIGRRLQTLDFQVKVMHRNAPSPDLVPISRMPIQKQIVSLLRDRRPEDTILLAFSGHGLQLKNDPVGPNGQKESYFCPGDTRLDDPGTLLPVSFIFDQLSKCRAGRKLLMFDACRNEILPRDRPKGVTIELDPVGIEPRSVPEGTVTFFSCKPTEQSFESAQLGHGVFTYHLLQYLNGKARNATYPGGRLLVQEFFSAVSLATRDYVDQTYSKDQTPQTVGIFNNWELGSIRSSDSATAQLPDDSRQPAAGDGKMVKALRTVTGRILHGGRLASDTYPFRSGDVVHATGKATIGGKVQYAVLTPKGVALVPASSFRETNEAATVPAGPRIVEVAALPAWYDKYLVDYSVVPMEHRKNAVRVPARNFVTQFLLTSEHQTQWRHLWRGNQPPGYDAVRDFLSANQITMHAGHQKKYAYHAGYIYDAVEVKIFKN